MNRYVVVKEFRRAEVLTSTTTSDSQPDTFCVVDLSQDPAAVVASCGDYKPVADKVALALNNLDGGPL